MDNILKLSQYSKSIFITVLLGLSIYFLINIGNMYVQPEKKLRLSGKKIIFTSLAIVLLVIIYNLFKGPSKIMQILLLVFYSIVIAYLLNPLVNRLEKKRISRTLSILLVYLAVIIFILIAAFSIAPKLSGEFQKLATVLPNYFNKIYDYFNDVYIRYSEQIDNLPPEFKAVRDVVLENLNLIQGLLLTSIRNVTSSAIGMFSKVISFVIIPVLTFYFLKDKEYFKKKLVLLIPKMYRNDVLRISREIDTVLGKFIRGQLIVATFVGIMTSIALLILGIDFAIIIGLIAGIADVIPYFGPIIGIVPAIIFALLESPSKALWVIVIFIIIQQLESNIIAPKVVGQSVGLHPIVVMLALLIGGSYFGIIGMLFAIPITAIFKIISIFIIDKISHV